MHSKNAFGFALLFVALCTNHLIIFSEEILIAFAFFGFVIFTQRYFGQTLRSTLEERRNALERELEGVLSRKEDDFTQRLHNEQKKAERKAHVQRLIQLTRREIHSFASTCESNLPRVLNENLHRRLQKIADGTAFQNDVQAALVQNLRHQVIFNLYSRRQASGKWPSG